MISLYSGLIIFFLKVVQGELYITSSGKDISKLSEPVKIIEGEDLLLECVSSFLDSTFIWTKDGADSSFGHTKQMTHIQVEDQGVYGCQATFNENNYTEIVENKDVFVEVLYPPSNPEVTPVYINGPYYALHGENITLMCQSGANPEPNYQWRRDSKSGPLLTRNSNHNMMVDSYIIDYYCIVQNRMVPTVGEPITTTLIRKLQIRVYVKAYIFKIEGGTYRSSIEGDTVTVPCVAFGRPPPRIWWTKEEDINFNLEGDKLSQTSVSVDFTGKYYCNVENTVFASNQTPITTRSKQEVQITVSERNNENEDIDIENCENIDMDKDEAGKNSENIALVILAGIGWLGFVMSGVIHLIVCTKNRNKARKAENNQPQHSSCPSYTSNVRIPENIYHGSFDRISTPSLEGSSTTSSSSNLTAISTLPSYDSLQQVSSGTNLHPHVYTSTDATMEKF